MDRFDLSRQGISSLAQVSDDIVAQVEQPPDDIRSRAYALSLAQNRIIEVHAIGRFANVCQLDLSSNKIVSLDGMQALQQLESLNVARNNLTSVDVLAALPRLRVLSVAENSIVQLDGLSACRELVALDASYNNVTKWPRYGRMATLESLDLSSNLLEAFAPPAVVELFPSSLRRLAIAKNQIHHLCGVAALGAHLTQLQSLNVDGNVAINQIVKSGGTLEYLVANLFAPGLALGSSGSRDSIDPVAAQIKRDAHIVSSATLANVQRAIQRGDEDALATFHRTGTLAASTATSDATAPLTRKAVVASTSHTTRFKVEELALPQPSSHATTSSSASQYSDVDLDRSRTSLPPASMLVHADPPASHTNASASALSKESKMEMWKRITEERKAQQIRDRDRRHQHHDEAATSALDPVVVDDSPALAVASRSRTMPMHAQESQLVVAQQPSPPPPPPPPSPPLPLARTVFPSAQARDWSGKSSATASRIDATVEGGRGGSDGSLGTASSETDGSSVAGYVKALSEQVMTMRKYMKVWIKREQIAREASARRIQRWLRAAQTRRAVAVCIHARQQQWRIEYSLARFCCLPRTTSSSQHQQRWQTDDADPLLQMWHAHACTLQRYARGLIDRQRLRRWRRLQSAACSIQRNWRRVLQRRHEVLRLTMSSLQQSCCCGRTRCRQSVVTAGVVDAVARIGTDVQQLQRVSIVHERAMVELWDSAVHVQRYVDSRLTRAVVRFQSLWRGHHVRRSSSASISTTRPRIAVAAAANVQRLVEQQACEIAELRRDVQTLQRTVEQLLTASATRPAE